MLARLEQSNWNTMLSSVCKHTNKNLQKYQSSKKIISAKNTQNQLSLISGSAEIQLIIAV